VEVGRVAVSAGVSDASVSQPGARRALAPRWVSEESSQTAEETVVYVVVVAVGARTDEWTRSVLDRAVAVD
jgi:hypothetical protein